MGASDTAGLGTCISVSTVFTRYHRTHTHAQDAVLSNLRRACAPGLSRQSTNPNTQRHPTHRHIKRFGSNLPNHNRHHGLNLPRNNTRLHPAPLPPDLHHHAALLLRHCSYRHQLRDGIGAGCATSTSIAGLPCPASPRPSTSTTMGGSGNGTATATTTSSMVVVTGAAAKRDAGRGGVILGAVGVVLGCL